MFCSLIDLIKNHKKFFLNHITTIRQDMHKEIRQIIHESIIFTLRFNNNTDLYVNWSLKVILINQSRNREGNMWKACLLGLSGN